MPRRLDRILLDLLRAGDGERCRCGEPIRPGAQVVLVMGDERHDPGAGVPRCRSCSAPLRALDEVIVVILRGAVRVPSAA